MRLAVLGGTAVRPAGPPEWPLADEDVRQRLEAACRDGSWGKYHGEYVNQLEHELARYHGVEFALTCCSGTFAVELALRALKLGHGAEVILSAYDYGGNFLSVLAVGARPVLVELDRNNWNMAPAEIEQAVSPATRAIIVSHLHGGVVPMSQVIEIARRHKLWVVEDAAQMPGARIEGRKAGTWGDVGALSFGGSKLLTAGRGGAVLTSNREIRHRARLFCQRGNHVFPLSELQAAVLLPQLAKLDARNARRAESVQLLASRLQGIPGLRLLRNSTSDTDPGYYKVGFLYDPSDFGATSRDRFVEAARAEGIAFDAGFRSLHIGRSPSRYRRVGDLSEAERAHHGMVVLHHPVLLGTTTDIEEVASAARKLYDHRHELAACTAEPVRSQDQEASTNYEKRASTN
ncbi:MAG: aminotransferase class V-fold PLP-dependent enzyme [Planctomycetes bacterium]|nr:aminotransferase class V-fold PLP-dependent enzyme [Planctomycetota bacterium]